MNFKKSFDNLLVFLKQHVQNEIQQKQLEQLFQINQLQDLNKQKIHEPFLRFVIEHQQQLETHNQELFTNKDSNGKIIPLLPSFNMAKAYEQLGENDKNEFWDLLYQCFRPAFNPYEGIQQTGVLDIEQMTKNMNLQTNDKTQDQDFITQQILKQVATPQTISTVIDTIKDTNPQEISDLFDQFDPQYFDKIQDIAAQLAPSMFDGSEEEKQEKQQQMKNIMNEFKNKNTRTQTIKKALEEFNSFDQNDFIKKISQQ